MIKPGDEIYILVNGHPVNTVIDEHGVQRFFENSVTRWLVTSGTLNLHDMAIAFYNGDFEIDDYVQFKMDLGYSVCGFDELFGPSSSYCDNTGEYLEIVNPVWLDKEELNQ